MKKVRRFQMRMLRQILLPAYTIFISNGRKQKVQKGGGIEGQFFRYNYWWNLQSSPARASCCLSCWLFWWNVSAVVAGNCFYSSFKKTSWLYERPKCDDICFYRHCRCLWLFLVSSKSFMVKFKSEISV